MLELESMKSENYVVNIIKTGEPNAITSNYRFGSKFIPKESTKTLDYKKESTLLPDYSKPPPQFNKIKFERTMSFHYIEVQANQFTNVRRTYNSKFTFTAQ